MNNPVNVIFLEAFAEGLREGQAYVNRQAAQLALIGLQLQADRTAAHADWFCSLPWWRRALHVAAVGARRFGR